MPASFRDRYPEVELDLTIGLTADLYARLDGGQLDLMTGDRRDGDLRGEPTLPDVEYIVVTAPGAGRPAQTLRDILLNSNLHR